MTRPGAALWLVTALAAAASACANFGAPKVSLAADPPSLAFTAPADGQSPPIRALAIDLLGAGRASWSAQADVPWLVVTPASDTAPSVAWVSVTTAGMGIGNYVATITVSASGDARGRVTVPVTLLVQSSLSLTGRWVGVSDSVNLALTLVQSGDTVTGSGSFYPPYRPLTVSGTYRSPAVTLTLGGPGPALTTFAGSLVNDNAIVATLNGGSMSGVQITVFRQ